ncbi:uncharacterized protein [Oryza sativa Japonica Group]|uniref:uncharacterized protein isoform X1 n=1 Tax=Oryza sativa subsp. japonica TaxID=39947 RepID=UPI00339CF475
MAACSRRQSRAFHRRARSAALGRWRSKLASVWSTPFRLCSKPTNSSNRQGAFDVGSSSSPSSPFPACTPASPAMPSLAPTSGKDDLNFVLFSVQYPFKIFQLVRMDREFRMVVGNLLQSSW